MCSHSAKLGDPRLTPNPWKVCGLGHTAAPRRVVPASSPLFEHVLQGERKPLRVLGSGASSEAQAERFGVSCRTHHISVTSPGYGGVTRHLPALLWSPSTSVIT